MPHQRKRYLLDIIRKKLKLSPVVAIQGPRQSGKSFLAQHFVSEVFPKARYKTFDQASERRFAGSNPDTYLSQYEEANPLIIDEAQKVPAIFDAIKFSVDQKRISRNSFRPGSTTS